MAGSVQETLPPQQTAKRSAEADPESTPLSKRPSESIEQNQQAQPMDASANVSIMLFAVWIMALILTIITLCRIILSEP